MSGVRKERYNNIIKRSGVKRSSVKKSNEKRGCVREDVKREIREGK